MSDQTIICPKCKNKIPLTEALSSQIKEQIKDEYELEYEKKNKELQDKEKETLTKLKESKEELDKKETELKMKALEIENSKKESETEIRRQVKEKTEKEMEKLEKMALVKARSEASLELKLRDDQLANKNSIIEDFTKNELDLRKRESELEEKNRLLEITKQREIDDAKKEIRQKALTEAAEQSRLKDKEKDKIIADLKKSLEDAQRKANQSSQQLQGEVQELDLEEVLRRAFPLDVIEPVGKGAKGADVRQIVKTQRGNICGVILWESKNTQGWKDEWLAKLKDDLRAEKANIPVIVSQTLPKGEHPSLIFKEGVCICTFGLVLPLAEMIRQRLVEVAKEKFISQNRTEKAEMLYEYVTGLEFRQQLEAMAEVYKDMHGQIMKEKAAMEKHWKTREAQVEKLFLATGGIVGSMAGRIGSSMPQIKGLELLESGEIDK